MKKVASFTSICLIFMCLIGCDSASIHYAPEDTPSLAPSPTINPSSSQSNRHVISTDAPFYSDNPISTPAVRNADEQIERHVDLVPFYDEIDCNLPFDKWPISVSLDVCNAEGSLIRYEATRYLSEDGWLLYILPGYEAHEDSNVFRIASVSETFVECNLSIETVKGTDSFNALHNHLSDLEEHGSLYADNSNLYGTNERVLPVSYYNDWETRRYDGLYAGNTVKHNGYFTHFNDRGERNPGHLFSFQNGEDTILITIIQNITDENVDEMPIMPELYAMLHTFLLQSDNTAAR